MQKVNILGTEYTIQKKKVSEDLLLEELDGYCDNSTKEIVTGIFKTQVGSNTDPSVHENTLLRHEIIHAFLYESGLDANSKWGTDEELVDWIALQFPKLLQAFIDAGAIDLPESNIVTKEVTIDSSEAIKAVIENVKKQLDESKYSPSRCL